MDTRVDEQTRFNQMIEETASRAGSAELSRFVRQFFEDVPPADLLGVGSGGAWALAQEFWEFAAVRRPFVCSRGGRARRAFQDGLGQLLDVQGHAVGALHDLRQRVGRQAACAEHRRDDLATVAAAELIER